MTARWGIGEQVRSEEQARNPSRTAPSGMYSGGTWSLMAKLEQISSELIESDQREDSQVIDRLRANLDEAAQHMQSRNRTELGDALKLAQSTLGRIAAVDAVRKAELDLLGRISRQLPSLLFARSTRPAIALRTPGPSVVRARLRPTLDKSAQTDGPLVGRSIVVVNEDLEIGWSQSHILHGAGAHVRLAFDGNDALELCRKVVPDVILADAFMSGLDGVALARSIRRHCLLRDMGIVLVGARRGLLDRLAKLGAAADAYLLDKADAPSILGGVTRSIESRRLVEAQLSTPGDVHGSLTSIAPRTLIVATTRLRPEAKITLRQGSDLYEAQVEGGSLVGVALTTERVQAPHSREATRRCLGLLHGDFCVA